MKTGPLYEYTCDFCGCASHYKGSSGIANDMAKEDGWVIIGDKHFCDEFCRKSHEVREAHKEKGLS